MLKSNSLLAALMLGASFTAHAATPHKVAYLTSWGLSDPAALEQSAVDTYILSFAQWDAQGVISASDDMMSVPKYDPYWLPTGYTTWTNLKLNHPQRKIMLAFGGQSYESIWSYITTPEAREILAQNIVALMGKDFPVYSKNLPEAKISGACLSTNWNGTCNLGNYQLAGTVQIDGVDFDFEKAARISPEESANLLALVTRIKALAPANKIMSLTTYHVGADPENCANSGITANCSYIETDRSAHNGEVSDLLVQSKNIFSFFNVMTYDAGKNFKYQVALQNYAAKVGDKSKVVMGNTINAQWAPDGAFVETDANNNARAKWQAQNGYGGLFVWNFGANTQQLSMADQVAKTNAMIAAMSGPQSPVIDPAQPVEPETPVTPARKEVLTMDGLLPDRGSVDIGTLLKSYKTIDMVAKDGAWFSKITLPSTGVAEGSVVKFRRAAYMETEIVSKDFGSDRPFVGETRTYTYTNGAWHSDAIKLDSLPDRGSVDIGALLSSYKTVYVVTKNAAWVPTLNLPSNGVAEGSVVRFYRDAYMSTDLVVNGQKIVIARYSSIVLRFKSGGWQL